MDTITTTVLSVVGLATAVLLIAMRTYVPRRIDEKYRDSLNAFSTAIELRFPSHEGLTQRVVGLSQVLAKQMGLHYRRLNDLEMAARLRDIGLCAIPYKLVNSKPFLEWDEGDLLTYMRHPEVSGAMLELIPSLRHLAEIVRCHHASYDGSDGPFYPSHDRLPIEARILCVVCEFVWQERRFGDLIARDVVREGSGTRFDPDVAERFLRMLTSASVHEPKEAHVLL